MKYALSGFGAALAVALIVALVASPGLAQWFAEHAAPGVVPRTPARPTGPARPLTWRSTRVPGRRAACG